MSTLDIEVIYNETTRIDIYSIIILRNAIRIVFKLLFITLETLTILNISNNFYPLKPWKNSTKS